MDKSAPAEAYTVVVNAGTYQESVESKRDGLADAPVTIKAASVGTVITNKQIVDLPLNGRDYLQLAAISSGTVPSRSGVGVSIGGQVGTSVSFLLDGVDNNSQTILPRLYPYARLAPMRMATSSVSCIAKQSVTASSSTPRR